MSFATEGSGPEEKPDAISIGGGSVGSKEKLRTRARSRADFRSHGTDRKAGGGFRLVGNPRPHGRENASTFGDFECH